jgi:hypothetical protein
MVNISIALSLGPTLAAIDANENQKVGDQLWGVEPPPLSSYNFVGLIEKRSIEQVVWHLIHFSECTLS